MFFILIGFLILDIYDQVAEEATIHNWLEETTIDTSFNKEDNLNPKEIDSETLNILASNNEDLIGWIKIEDTNIDYPVMYTPQIPEFYLHRNIYKEYSVSGTPFLSGDCALDSRNYIIYGHNMKNGTMFHDLLNYSDENFYQNHKIIEYTTNLTQNHYEIVSCFYTQIPNYDESIFLIYNYTNLKEDKQLTEFLSNIKSLSLYDTGTQVSKDDFFITLSTCSYHTDNGRFIVIAKKL